MLFIMLAITTSLVHDVKSKHNDLKIGIILTIITGLAMLSHIVVTVLWFIYYF